MTSGRNFDVNGKPWATVEETKAGDVLVTDGSFTCMVKRVDRQVFEDGGGLYVTCMEGRHYLFGQLSEDKTCYVGLYRKEKGA